MKVCLINPDYMLYGDAPLGLAYLASYIKKVLPETQIKILDQMPLKKIIKTLKRDQPEIIGLSSVSENWFNVKKIAQKIKKVNQNSKLVIGGVHITTDQQSFENSPFDYAVLGEGEIPFSKLVNLIDSRSDLPGKLKKIRGLMFRDKGKVISTEVAEQITDLSNLPPPDLDLLCMEYYSLPKTSVGFKRVFTILTSRGCPYNCRFCSSSRFWEKKIRFFSSDRVVIEIERLYKKYKFNKISIADDLFSINEERLNEIVDKLEEKELLGKIEFTCAGRANLFKESTAKLLKKMGVSEVYFGFESGSNKVLKWLKKDTVDIQDNKQAIKICKNNGLIASGFFMLGSPYETKEDMEKTYKFIKDYCEGNFIIYQTIPYPGTEIWEYAIKNNIIKTGIYEKPTKEFVDLDSKYLLTKEVSIKEFEAIFEKVNRLKRKREKEISIKNINLRAILNPLLLKKAWVLRKRFLKRIK